MTAIYWLQEDAADADRHAARLTIEIEDTERRIVELRRKREDVWLHAAESRAAANVLGNVGFNVDRDTTGVVTVHVDPLTAPEPPEPEWLAETPNGTPTRPCGCP